MGKNEFDRAVVAALKILNKFSGWGLSAGFVYTTEEGFLKFYGSEAIGTVIDKYQAEITTHPSFSHRSEDDHDGPDCITEEAGQMVLFFYCNPYAIGFCI
jgi:hypothetical protein